MERNVIQMKTYKDICKTQKELLEKNFSIENNILKSIEINLIAHFGNIATLEMFFEDCCLFSNYNLGTTIPFILKSIIEILDLSEEDGLRISKIKNVPVRIVLQGNGLGRIVGFGHFMKDRFVLAEDLIEISKENLKGLKY